jgi:hypothetical protein
MMLWMYGCNIKMFTCRTNTDRLSLLHVAPCETEAVKASVLRVQSQARCDLQNRDFSGFLRFRTRADRCAITRSSYNRETLYTDECFMNHGTAALCKRLLETGKWLTLAIGSRYERLIIELHRLADNSTGRYGYNLRLTRG